VVVPASCEGDLSSYALWDSEDGRAMGLRLLHHVLVKQHRELKLQEPPLVSCRTETGRYLRDIRSTLPTSGALPKR